MEKLLGAKVGKLGLDELVLAGLTKYAEEKVLANTFVGNNSLMSGAIKLATAMGINYVADGHKYGKAVALGFGVDGIEDILNSVLGGVLGGQGSSIQGI